MIFFDTDSRLERTQHCNRTEYFWLCMSDLFLRSLGSLVFEGALYLSARSNQYLSYCYSKFF